MILDSLFFQIVISGSLLHNIDGDNNEVLPAIDDDSPIEGLVLVMAN